MPIIGYGMPLLAAIAICPPALAAVRRMARSGGRNAESVGTVRTAGACCSWPHSMAVWMPSAALAGSAGLSGRISSPVVANNAAPQLLFSRSALLWGRKRAVTRLSAAVSLHANRLLFAPSVWWESLVSRMTAGGKCQWLNPRKSPNELKGSSDPGVTPLASSSQPRPGRRFLPPRRAWRHRCWRSAVPGRCRLRLG